MAEQSRELDKTMDELTLTERENRLLRRSVELLADEKDVARYDTENLNSERERLMKKLIETEMDGQATVKQIEELRDALRRLKEENRISGSDGTRLAKQKDLLLEKLADFEATNKALRRIYQKGSGRWVQLSVLILAEMDLYVAALSKLVPQKLLGQ